MDSQQVFLVPQIPPLPPASSKVYQQQQTTTQMLQQQQQQQPQPPQCSICGTTQKLLRCAKCKAIYYCSTDHQHLDWPTHKQECRALAKQRQINNRLQQLTNGCGAININAHSNSCNSSTSLTSSWSSNYPFTPANDNLHQQQQNFKSKQLDGSFVLGTHENEILNSKAETVTQNSNSSEYMGNIDANSTTTDQMHNIMPPNPLDPSYGLGIQPYNDNNYYYHTMPTQLDKGQLDQTLLSQLEQSQFNNQSDTLVGTTYTPPPPILDQQQQSNKNLQQMPVHQQPQQPGYMPQPQTSLQYPVPQLSNYLINQHEKSSSYQIGAAVVDENLFENANERRYEELCRNIISDMNQYGLSVVDDFLGREKGLQILNEVHKMYSAGVFKDGQLVNNMKSEQDLRTIRGDKITWVKGVERGCSNVGYLINQIDAVICRANSMRNNGKLGDYVIKERTKAMVACYPGSGSHYVMHVDNPNKDGRVITAIYYLNLDWDSRNSGGVLRIFPEQTKSVADIEPKFDRLIFFWSDKRNPHEVQPAHRTRYAITVWYFDANEREQALNRCKNSQNSNNANSVLTSNTGSASSNSNIDNNSTDDTANTTSSSTCPASTPASTPNTQSLAATTSLSSSASSSAATTNDISKNPAATTNTTIQNSTRPIQVVRPNSYK
ncbi:hypoxia-inducible factor prolyl hydroxylase [Lucilia cuprina]|uniref:hypoxia-inducible factor prolyl hydroxylase n=1 Tax=Lucilia cuprina TaxID=7375 RepID=UPI001F060D25|nr:hypoxia-inducible factor prolyl hydroxylase [Lucilia cuprina]